MSSRKPAECAFWWLCSPFLPLPSPWPFLSQAKVAVTLEIVSHLRCAVGYTLLLNETVLNNAKRNSENMHCICSLCLFLVIITYLRIWVTVEEHCHISCLWRFSWTNNLVDESGPALFSSETVHCYRLVTYFGSCRCLVLPLWVGTQECDLPSITSVSRHCHGQSQT